MKGSEYRPGLRVCKRRNPYFKQDKRGYTEGEPFFRPGVSIPYCMVRWDDSAMPESMSIHALQIIVYEPQQGEIAS